MIGQIIITVFVIWLFIGLLLVAIGIFIDDCTKLFTWLDTLGLWFLLLWVMAVLIALFVSAMILLWR